MRFATFVSNRSLTKGTKEKKTPYELYFGEVPDLGYLKTFGCVAVALRDDSPNAKPGKVEPRGKSMIYMGPAANMRAYLMWDPDAQKEFVSKYARFFEDSPGSDILRNPSSRRTTRDVDGRGNGSPTVHARPTPNAQDRRIRAITDREEEERTGKGSCKESRP